jgi:hypothetical protein
MSGPIRPVITQELDPLVRMAAVGCGFPDISSWVNAVLTAELSGPIAERHVAPTDPVYIRGLLGSEDERRTAEHWKAVLQSLQEAES